MLYNNYNNNKSSVINTSAPTLTQDQISSFHNRKISSGAEQIKGLLGDFFKAIFEELCSLRLYWPLFEILTL